MKIQLKKLSIINFKGIRNFMVDFNHVTNVYGDNATGKTTVFDAFLWLFFGKNSEDASQFEIKRLDEYNKFIKDLEAEVSAIVWVDGEEIAIKKVLRQKWTKRRGELEANYSGDENIYYWNDVPLKETDFKVKIKAIIDEALFRLITNPFYFNSLKWQERRNTLMQMAGDITHESVFTSLGIKSFETGPYAALVKALNQKKTIDEFKSQIAAQKKKIKDEAESIPSRIDEVKRGMPDELNFAAIEETLAEKKSEAESIQLALNDEVAKLEAENKQRTKLQAEHNAKVQGRQQKIFDLKTLLQNIEFEAKTQARGKAKNYDSEIISLTSQVADKKLRIEQCASKLKSLEQDLTHTESKIQSFRNEYASIDEEQLIFDDHQLTCPTCKQFLPENQIESKKAELTGNFNKEKSSRLNVIVKKAEEAKQDIENFKSRITAGKEMLANLNSELNKLEIDLDNAKQQALTPTETIEEIQAKILADNNDYSTAKASLKTTEETVLEAPVFDSTTTNTELREKLKAVNIEINRLQMQLIDRDVIDRSKERIVELERQENTLAQQLAEQEGIEYAILQFNKARVDLIERKINGKFKYVKFKMFTQQVNGGEAECCETLVNTNGSYVPFDDANYAGKVNAGIDIINAFCTHYSAYAPIFVDNRESVTRLIDSESQIINLFKIEGALLSVDKIKYKDAKREAALV